MMRRTVKRIQLTHLSQMLLCGVLALVALVALVSPVLAASSDTADLTPAEMKRLGERMYREGLLSNGKPLRGYVREDVEVDSTMFSCANCHTRSGLGSVEGQVASPPVNGASLFNPRYLYKDTVKNAISKSKGVPRTAPQTRPAYTDETLAHAIRGGVNPDGRVLLPIMPRYYLEDRDMQILTSYLRSLSAEYSPGVTDQTLQLATIITDDVSTADRAAMMGILNTLVKINQQTREQRKHPQFSKMFRMLDNAYFRYISIEPWELKGPPETWRQQLETYYRKKPVFAILGGISGKTWQPMHDFCESNQIPCLLPITDLPVISESSWYTLYASKGYYQEGETAARFLAGQNSPSPRKKVLQVVVTTPEGEALASGFDTAWKEVGQEAVTTVRLSPDKQLGKKELDTLLQKHQPGTVLLWGGPEALPLLDVVGKNGATPDLFLSSRYVGTAMGNIPEGLRKSVFITYPYRLPEDEKRYAGYADVLQLDKHQKDGQRIASRTFSMVHVFLQGLKELRLDFYRDTLLDLIGMLPDQNLPDFERYSFGPGQRYASKGCYIVQLGQGAEPQLIRKSDWVVH